MMRKMFKIAALSEAGRAHERNEDCWKAGLNFIVIADGMGGCAAGHVASQIVTITVAKGLEKMNNVKGDGAASKVGDVIRALLKKADDEINSYINQNPETDGMGSTALVMVQVDDAIYLGWCGDSRAFIYDGQNIKSLTQDHSYVQELVNLGKITQEEAFVHPDNNLLTRYVGGGHHCVPEIVESQFNPGDILILCTDGLSGYCREEEIKETIERAEDFESLPKRLKTLTLARGCEDDITIVAVKRQEKSRLLGLFGL